MRGIICILFRQLTCARADTRGSYVPKQHGRAETFKLTAQRPAQVGQLVASCKAGPARPRAKERGGPPDHVMDIAGVAVSNQMEACDGVFHSRFIYTGVGGRGQSADTDQ